MNDPVAEWVAIRKSIEDDPANRNTSGGPWLYSPNARKRLDKIDREIADLLAQKRAASGNPVPCTGYSGRQTNRKR